MSEPSTEERPAIAAAVIVKDGQVLLVRRRVKEGSLSWQFPAGMVKPGVPAEQVAVRETLAETGVHVVVMPGELTTAIGAIGDPEGVLEVAGTED